jgi:ATP-dependent Clp protease ATP-binding subunit ClpC
MEEGRLTDSFGRHIDFKNVILIMTSNLGSHLMKSGATLGFGSTQPDLSAEEKTKKLKMDIMFEVERHFRPEFLNRLDEVVMFNPLTKDDITRIVHLQLDEVLKRVADQGLKLVVDTPALEFLIEKGFHEDYGARPMRRAIERYIEDPLAESLLKGEFELNQPVRVSREGSLEEAEALSFAQGDNQPAEEPAEAAATSSEDGDAS